MPAMSAPVPRPRSAKRKSWSIVCILHVDRPAVTSRTLPRVERRQILLIGDGDIANETAEALEGAGAATTRLDTPDEDDVRDALDGATVDTVAIVSRDDAFVLRAALVVRYVADDVPMLVTIFDETMAAHVRSEIRECRVTSLADIVAPSLA